MGYYIGIDMGTSSVKLVLTDETGIVISEASREYSLLQPAPGWKEIEAGYRRYLRIHDALNEIG